MLQPDRNHCLASLFRDVKVYRAGFNHTSLAFPLTFVSFPGPCLVKNGTYRRRIVTVLNAHWNFFSLVSQRGLPLCSLCRIFFCKMPNILTFVTPKSSLLRELIILGVTEPAGTTQSFGALTTRATDRARPLRLVASHLRGTFYRETETLA